MHVMFFFLDGVGLGDPDPSANPFFAGRLPVLRSLMGGIPSLEQRRLDTAHAVTLPLDATLGVKGLPQSGTGQASLLAGINGPRRVGHHFGPHPPSALREEIGKQNIFQRVLNAGKVPCFANAFPQRFFDYMRAHQGRLSMTTLSCTLSGLPLRQEADLREGRAVSADLTGEGWRELGYADMPIITPRDTGRRLAALAASHHLTLFEYWKTDFAGHAQNMAEAIAVLERFDAMLEGFLDASDGSSTLTVLSSDHGNIEDLRVRTHTRNPVPLLLHGRQHRTAAERILKHARPNLSHVTPAVMEMLEGV